MENNDETKHTRYEQKRKRINLSLKAPEQRKMKEKYGCILTGSQVKEIVFQDHVKIITKNRDPHLIELIKKLTKIGNNLNQIAKVANQQKTVTVEIFAKLHVEEIKKIITEIRNHIWHDH